MFENLLGYRYPSVIIQIPEVAMVIINNWHDCPQLKLAGDKGVTHHRVYKLLKADKQVKRCRRNSALPRIFPSLS